MKKVCFLLSFIPNPRINKRIKALKEYYQTNIIYWIRGKNYAWGNVDSEEINQIPITINIENKKPLYRLPQTCKFSYIAIKNLRLLQPDCIYVQGMDMLFIACIYKTLFKLHVKIIYEIADLHPLVMENDKDFLSKLTQMIFRKLDCQLCKNISLLIVTSERYYDFYFNKFIPPGKYLFMPNTPDIEAFINYEKKSSGEFTIGFIGGIQCKEQLKLLIQAAEICQIKLRIAGAGLDDEIEKICNEKQIYYHGKYNFMSEAAQLYSKIDCIFAVYNVNDFNVRVALPNKLYEAIYCEIPILVAKNTYLSEIIEKNHIGVSVKFDELDSYIQAIKLLKNKNFRDELSLNCRNLQKEISYSETSKKFIAEVTKILS